MPLLVPYMPKVLTEISSMMVTRINLENQTALISRSNFYPTQLTNSRY
ncbi:unnamed protein product, partial [Strongylus vulgaris]